MIHRLFVILTCFLIMGCAERNEPQNTQEAIPEDNMQNREIQISLQAPDAGWSVQIEEVYLMDQEIWVLAQLHRQEGMAAQMITTVSDSVIVEAPNWPVKVFILGKTWGWENEEPYEFLENDDNFIDWTRGRKIIYPIK